MLETFFDWAVQLNTDKICLEELVLVLYYFLLKYTDCSMGNRYIQIQYCTSLHP